MQSKKIMGVVIVLLNVSLLCSFLYAEDIRRELIISNSDALTKNIVATRLSNTKCDTLILEDGVDTLETVKGYLDSSETRYNMIFFATLGDDENRGIPDNEDFNIKDWVFLGQHLIDNGILIFDTYKVSSDNPGRYLHSRIAHVPVFFLTELTDDNVSAESIFVVTSNADSGEGTLRDGIENGATKIFFDSSMTIMLKSNISIGNSVHIYGMTTDKNTLDITIDGNNHSNIFHVNSVKVNLSIENITFTKGYANPGGAVDFFEKPLRMSGGAIMFKGNNLTITGSTFTSNSPGGGGGGAVCFDGNKLKITGSAFTENSADGSSGGAVCIRYCLGGAAITDSIFTSNKAGSGGAVCFVNRGLGSLTITSSTFTSNSSVRGIGGAIDFTGNGSRNLTITGSVFTENKTEKLDKTIAVSERFEEEPRYVPFSVRSINGGGAVYVSSENISLIITDSIFTSNSTGDSGGAIYVHSENNNLIITDSTFIKNSADGGGGVVQADFSNLTIKDSVFTENFASSGGVISTWANKPANIIITGSTFTKNLANMNAGAIYSGNYFGNLTITGSTFTENKIASDYSSYFFGGGAIHYKGNLTVIDSAFTENSTNNGDGGAIYFDSNSCDTFAIIIDSSFNQNTAVNNGGAIFFRNYAGNLTITGSTFTSNFAKAGGAVYLYPTYGENHAAIPPSTLNILNSTFYQNTAGKGETIYMINGTINLLNSIVFGNIFFEPRLIDYDPGHNYIFSGAFNSAFNILAGEITGTYKQKIDLNNNITATPEEVFVTGKLEDNVLKINPSGPAAGTGIWVGHQDNFKVINYSVPGSDTWMSFVGKTPGEPANMIKNSFRGAAAP